MNWQSGITLFYDLSPLIQAAIANESMDRRVLILAQLLAAFALSGADIRDLFGHSEDVDAALTSLRLSRKIPNVDYEPFEFTIDMTRIGLPSSYDFMNGPFDGSSFRLGTGIHEIPPETITLQPDPTSSRGQQSEVYKFEARTTRDRDGNEDGQEIAYYYQPSRVAKGS